MKTPKIDLETIRQAVADYMKSEGCDCCEDKPKHEEDYERLARLLDVPAYKDGSGYDFGRFETKK